VSPPLLDVNIYVSIVCKQTVSRYLWFDELQAV
ncbi:hypothetical protein QIL14_gp1, partial [ssRNA phage Gephyllon.4_12]